MSEGHKPGILFWIIGVLALLWNGFGLLDLVMTMTNNEAYLADYPQELLAYWRDMPFWRDILWIVGVGTAVIAAILFLLRNKLAAPLYAVAPVSMVIGLAHDAAAGGIALMGTGGLFGSLVILAVSTALWWYARRQAKRGVLR
jgi:hypothetical protein